MLITYPFNFTPREYQKAIFKAVFLEKIKHIILIQHRRAGKDRVTFQIICGLALQRVGLHFYLFPHLNQARKAIWKGRSSDGISFLEQIPKQLIKRINNTEMSIELINKSIIQFSGTNNIDNLVGTNPLSIAYSEFALHHPQARQLLSPILAENNGTEILNFTPRGKNHAYKLYELARQDNKHWFVQRLTIEDTKRQDGIPVITQEQIDFERKNGMAEETIRQEFYCDFNVGMVGAYYTAEMDRMELEGRICQFDVRPHQPVFTFWDIGVRDSTAIIFMQQSNGFISIFDYHEETDKGLDHFAKILHDKKIKYAIPEYTNHFAPHDIMNREWAGSARSRMAIAKDYHIHFLRAPDLSILDGIAAVRSILPEVRIHTRCKGLIDALKEYRREYDEEHRVFKDKPLHNWASNCADAIRYMAAVWRNQFMKPEENQIKSYQTKGFDSGFLLDGDRRYTNNENTSLPLQYVR